MSRKQPAYFDVEGPDGRAWRVRVGPLGIEAINHEREAANAEGGGFRRFSHGQERFTEAWRDLLPGRGQP